jgi:hypothetical protein
VTGYDSNEIISIEALMAMGEEKQREALIAAATLHNTRGPSTETSQLLGHTGNKGQELSLSTYSFATIASADEYFFCIVQSSLKMVLSQENL